MYVLKRRNIMLKIFIVLVLDIILLTLRLVAFAHSHKNSDKTSKVLDATVIIFAFGLQVIPILLENITIT